MRNRRLQWLSRVSLGLSFVSLGVWLFSLQRGSQTLGEFLQTGQRIQLVKGFVYVTLSDPPTAAQQALDRQIDAEMTRLATTGGTERRIATVDGFSGDYWLVLGWSRLTVTRDFEGIGGIVLDREGFWISPWAGVFAGLVLPITLRLLKMRQCSIEHARQLRGLCPTCAYDLRASIERCPECGTAIPEDLMRKSLTPQSNRI